MWELMLLGVGIIAGCVIAAVVIGVVLYAGAAYGVGRGLGW